MVWEDPHELLETKTNKNIKLNQNFKNSPSLEVN